MQRNTRKQKVACSTSRFPPQAICPADSNHSRRMTHGRGLNDLCELACSAAVEASELSSGSLVDRTALPVLLSTCARHGSSTSTSGFIRRIPAALLFLARKSAFCQSPECCDYASCNWRCGTLVRFYCSPSCSITTTRRLRNCLPFHFRECRHSKVHTTNCPSNEARTASFCGPPKCHAFPSAWLNIRAC